MTLQIPRNFGPVSKLFANKPVEDELSAGISTGFGRIGYAGKIWSTKYRGVEDKLMREDGDGPKTSIEVIILKSSTYKAKLFYKDGFKEGSSEPPDCSSSNGVVPDPNSKNKHSNTCDGCPMNIVGSKITAAGKQTRACSDLKRVAVVPALNIENEALGGPMLLNIPAASLGEAASFSQKMAQMGYPLHSVAVRISFDINENYPKFVFSPIRPLDDEEAARILELRDDPRVVRILSETSEARPDAPPAPAMVFEQPPQPKPAPAPAAAPVPAHDAETGEITEAAPQKREYKKKPAAPAPAPEPIEGAAPTATSFDDALDAQLDQLLRG